MIVKKSQTVWNQDCVLLSSEKRDPSSPCFGERTHVCTVVCLRIDSVGITSATWWCSEIHLYLIRRWAQKQNQTHVRGRTRSSKIQRMLQLAWLPQHHQVSKLLKLQYNQNHVSGVREVAESCSTPSVCDRTMF